MKVGDNSRGIVLQNSRMIDTYPCFSLILISLLNHLHQVASRVKCTLVSQPLSSLCYVGNIGSADDEELFIS